METISDDPFEDLLTDAEHQFKNEDILLSKVKRKARRKQKKKEKENIDISPQNCLKVELLSDDYEIALDPSVVMLKSIVDEISDAAIIWEVVQSKIFSHLKIWNILLDKASHNFDLTDISKEDSKTKQRMKFLNVLEEIELVLNEFKSFVKICLVTENSENPLTQIRFPPILSRALEKDPEDVFQTLPFDKIDSSYQDFFRFEPDDSTKSPVPLPNPATIGSKLKIKSTNRARDSSPTNSMEVFHSDQEFYSQEDPGYQLEDELRDENNHITEDQPGNDKEKYSSPILHPNGKSKSSLGVKRKRKVIVQNGEEKELNRPFKKNAEDKRYYCTIPGCAAGATKNWTCSSGVWKHFISEHSAQADGAFCVFECDSCERKFPTKALLNQHQKEKHISHFEFVCTVCAKRLPNNVALLVHMRMHTGEKPYACDLCSYRSIRRSAVSQHKLRMHENDNELRQRHHVCEKCGKTFKERCKLKEHIKTHSEAKTFLCGYCGKGLKNRQSFNRHLFTHGVKNECNVCGKNFSSQASLFIHHRDKHGMSI